MNDSIDPIHTDLNGNLAAIRSRMAEAAAMAKRDVSNIELLAVSKGQPVRRIRALFNLGQIYFGENYAQELLKKAAECKDITVKWVFIGSLQSNKIAKIVAAADEIQTVASIKQAHLIAKAARTLGKIPFPIYIAVNAAPEKEPQKSGVPIDDVPQFVEALSTESRLEGWDEDLEIRGILSIPPPLSDLELTGDDLPPLYRLLRQVANGVGSGRLSLGMSQDMDLAIMSGSDCVRIGSALLGERQSPDPRA